MSASYTVLGGSNQLRIALLTRDEFDRVQSGLTFFERLRNLTRSQRHGLDLLVPALYTAWPGGGQAGWRGGSRLARPSSLLAAARHVGQVSRDWAQVRPEWGLSSNAAFIIGRRSLTRNLKLDGRAFLHNYDQSQDETGRALEAIMTAPLVVCQMINFQYYFSATDSWAYGSGTKVLHNVVSGVGVMLGRHSDLQTGFPFQALTTGTRRFHEPLRLITVIEADTGRISQIISRHVVLQNFFENQWIYLVSCHPTTGEFSQYQPGGTWKAISLPRRPGPKIGRKA